MAIRKCPICGAEYDDETNESCPVCAENAQQDEKTEIEDAFEPADVASETTDEVQSDEAAPNSTETSGGSRRVLTVVAAVLAVLVIAAAGWLVYGRFAGVAPDTINVKKFGASDLSGTYNDDINGVFIEFDNNSATVEVPVSTQDTEASSDASAGSDAAQATETKSFDGSFTSGYVQDLIPNVVARDYIMNNGKAEDYEKYRKDNSLKKDDFIAYIKANDLEDDMDQFDAEQSVTEYLTSYKMSGYWDFADGLITLYDESGEKYYDLMVTKNGLVIADALFAGTPKKGEAFETEFVYKSAEGDYTQTVRTYKDGYFILINETDGSETDTQMMAGTYSVSNGIMSLVINGSYDRFIVTDFGITPYLYNK